MPFKNNNGSNPPSTPQRDAGDTTLTTNTRITFALLGMLGTPLLVGVVLYFKVDAMQRDMRQTWSVQQQIVWSERLGAQNPTMKVPPVDDVLRLVNRNHNASRE